MGVSHPSRPLTHSQKISKEQGAIDGEEALGVKLDTFDALAAIGKRAAETHHHAAGFGLSIRAREGFIAPGADCPCAPIGLRACGDGVFEDDEGVVARRDEGIGEPGEEALVVVVDGAGLAVHGDGVAGDGHAIGICHALMAQADAEDGDAAGEAGDDGGGDASFFGRAGTGGDDDVGGAAAVVEGFGLIGCDLVVANHEHVGIGFEGGIDLTETVDEIPGEGVVVVDEENHAVEG